MLTLDELSLREAAVRINTLLLGRNRDREAHTGAQLVLLAAPTKGEFVHGGTVRRGARASSDGR